jgi:hypothetical protein
MGDRSVRAWRCAPGGGSASFPANLRQPAANSSAARWGDGYSRASLRRTDDCARTRTARRFDRSPVSRNRWRTGLPGSAADRSPAHGVPLSRAHGGVRFAGCCSRPGRLSALQPRTGRCATCLWRHGVAGRARDDAPLRRPGAGYRCTRWRLSWRSPSRRWRAPRGFPRRIAGPARTGVGRCAVMDRRFRALRGGKRGKLGQPCRSG